LHFNQLLGRKVPELLESYGTREPEGVQTYYWRRFEPFDKERGWDHDKSTKVGTQYLKGGAYF
jgi:hypothetical protein